MVSSCMAVTINAYSWTLLTAYVMSLFCAIFSVENAELFISSSLVVLEYPSISFICPIGIPL